MRKKYSDPLMFPAALLTIGNLNPSQEGTIGGGGSGDDEWDNLEGAGSANGLMIDSAPAQQASNPVTIVNPVEEAVTSTDVVTEESSSAGSSVESSPLEVTPVIDQIVPDETAETAASGISE